ncbi:aldo/keto reductase [Gordonia humi]|uniref:Aryl-alcohol dehydrogenase-like predicted oxidoreductase n=1 Tax=Gordonia humi TaxID=686429 RepID=A0A840F7D2_9ACTN|nr:aldo/keto reductase [Gordonia humi]MBB4137489.1 aryl-alcohol dehydrogenase-like predicted oxidoreductase [Gordonia humi]
MDYSPLGNSGLVVSALGVGCNAFGRRIDQNAADDVVYGAFDNGVNFFDTADSYSAGESEVMLGKALGGRRDEVVIATKFGMDNGGLYPGTHTNRASRSYIMRAVEGSLQRLGTDYIDLYQLHTPDRITPIDETLSALSDLVASGKVRYIGCSNFASWEVADAAGVADAIGSEHFITAQNEYSLYNRSAETELVPALEHYGMSLLPYFPLAYGLLTGKYSRDAAAPAGSRLVTESFRYDGANWDIVEGIRAFADERGISMLDVALGGLRAQPAVDTIIAGATSSTQIAANATSVMWTPSDDDLAALDEAVPPGSGSGYLTFAPPQR